MANEDIRVLLIKSNLKMTDVAKYYEMLPSNFSRKLRTELSNRERKFMIKAIEELAIKKKKEEENEKIQNK